MTYDPRTTRAVAVGLPARLRAEVPLRVPGLVDMSHDLAGAAAFVADNPHVAVVYGEELFGVAVTGQPAFLLPEQRADDGRRHIPRVMLMMDIPPRAMANLEWDDPRLLAGEAGLRLRAGAVIDVSDPRSFLALDQFLDGIVDMPPRGGVPSTSGNDENGDPT